MTRLLLCTAAFSLLMGSTFGSEHTSRNLSEDDLISIRNGFDDRVAETFQTHTGQPLQRAKIKPPLGPGRPLFSRDYSWSLLTYAARCFWNNESIASANIALIENADFYLGHLPELCDRDNTHWHSEMLLRLIEQYGKNGSKRPGVLSTESENKILESLWLYCKRKEPNPDAAHISIADHENTETWAVMESENHHVQSFCTLWHFAKLAKHRPRFKDRLYDDGRSSAEHYASWNEYIDLYLTERAKKGLFVEMMSLSYNTDLLKGIFNICDFAEDQTLQYKATMYLDLYFSYWGQEQINGISGGGKSRIYTDINPGTSGYGYFFFGVGEDPGLRGQLLTAMTTSYRPSLVVVDIVCDIQGRGVYEVSQRPQGMVDTSLLNRPAYNLRTDGGGILRYSFCTPSFILGTAMLPSRPNDDWAKISSQNRSHGALLSGKPISFILPQCEKTNGRTAYNTQWSVQKKGTLICQKLRSSAGAGRSMVWFSKNGLTKPLLENGWLFAEANSAYAAVRVVDGGFTWETKKNANLGKWLICENDYSPIILEVAEKATFDSFETFRETVANQAWEFQDNILQYTGLDGDSFTFFADHSKPPEINGETINYAPSDVFDSPFLQSQWNSGVVTIKKGVRERVLDFNKPTEAAK
ncbi:hypothetical protein [Planctomycetes bacterium CA13]